MPNPYKKSSNPYKKAEEVQKKAPGSRPATQQPVVPAEMQQPAEPKMEEKKQEFVQVEQPVEAPIIEEKQVVSAPVVEEKPVEPVKENVIIETEVKKNLLAGLVEEKPKAKAYTFYLDVEVVEALEKLAKKSKAKSVSKLLNTLLRNILLDNK